MIADNLFRPITIIGISIVWIVLAIGLLRLPAFFVLMLAAMLVSLMAAVPKLGDDRYLKALELVTTEFGATAGKIGFTLALAAVIGECLTKSGAADKIVSRLIELLGEKRAVIAFCVCGFVLAAAVFVDTVFMLLIPLARALSLHTRRNYLEYILAIGAGAVISNGIVPPAPGPLFVAETLKIPLGHAILAGVAFGVIPLVGGISLARGFGARQTIPVRAILGGGSDARAPGPSAECPGILLSIAPVFLPLALIAAAACTGVWKASLPPDLVRTIQFAGDKNVALIVGVIAALWGCLRGRRPTQANLAAWLGAPLEGAGLIILIVAAGGAYGATIKNTGVGEEIRGMIGGRAFNPVLLAWTISALIRAAQGSATVATITAVGIMISIGGPAGFPVNPIYILLGVGFGSKFLPWMNDSGFWIVCRMSGLTSGEMLRSWSPALSLVSLIGLAEVLILAHYWPLLPL